MITILTPDWNAPASVVAGSTTRQGGDSKGPYAKVNLSFTVGDDPASVAANRAQLEKQLQGRRLGWLNQVHGTQVIDWDHPTELGPADASFTRKPDVACVVMTGDCLPVLCCDRAGTWVAAIHGGWRGLAAGILPAVFARASVAPQDCLAWLGPAISGSVYQVGAEVRDVFISQDPEHAAAFHPHPEGGWYADLYALARHILYRIGVPTVTGGNFCTYTDEAEFFSHRRDKGLTGRQASFIFLSPP